jgi:hypothetical protein
MIDTAKASMDKPIAIKIISSKPIDCHIVRFALFLSLPIVFSAQKYNFSRLQF